MQKVYSSGQVLFIFAQLHGCVKAEEENVNKTEQIVVKAHLSCYIVIKINS